jgi:putative cell wall-binding protein
VTEPDPTDPPATEPDPTDPKPTDPKPSDPETPDTEGVTRLAGENRIITSFLVADQLKEKTGVEKFENIIVASGSTFADALPGSYLSAVKNAPILLTLSKQKYIDQTADYIRENLVSGGTVYILGGESAVPASMEKALEGMNVQRVAGKDRFGTNLEILKTAGVKPGEEILVCTAKEFADSLSASAVGKPILLVYKKITQEQTAYLQTLSGNSFVVVGGTNAVPDSLAQAIGQYGSVERLAGKDRLETSTMVADRYFRSASAAVAAYGWNFPDGLCGGSLAYSMKAPLILTHSKTKLYTFTADYTTKAGLKAGYVLGGEGLVSDEATRAIFGMGSEPIRILE